MDAHAHAQFAKDGVYHLHQLQFVNLGTAADDVYIALVELTVAAFLGTVGPPDRLDLEALEGEGDLALVLYHVTGERHGEVVSEALFAHLRGQGLVKVHAAEGVAGIEDAEQELVPFLAVLAQQGGKILLRRGLDFLIPVSTENAADGIEYIVATGHFFLAEIAGSLWDGRLLNGHLQKFFQS